MGIVKLSVYNDYGIFIISDLEFYIGHLNLNFTKTPVCRQIKNDQNWGDQDAGFIVETSGWTSSGGWYVMEQKSKHRLVDSEDS